MSWEIERRFLLDRAPVLPDSAISVRIEQGYLSPHQPDPKSPRDAVDSGRLRRVRLPDGSFVHFHTLKTGVGVVRFERERRITADEFQEHWPRTNGRRLQKIRYKVPDGSLVWEVDVFDRPDLVIAEIELPNADAPISFPAWLKPHIVREVTDDPAYTNASIALSLGRQT